jgi:hypothetical protein
MHDYWPTWAHWPAGLQRIDGVKVGQLPSGAYVVLGPKPARTVNFCPVCDQELRTSQAAIQTADAVFPLADEMRPDGLMINGLLPAQGWEG